MGLCYQTSRWLDRLWSEHLEMSQLAQDLVKSGIKKQGAGFAGFPADLQARLYLPADPQIQDGGPEWAVRLHILATELSEWHRLRAMCARNGFAAGIATEALLRELLPHIPDHPMERSPEVSTAQGGASPSQRQAFAKSPPRPSDAVLRASLRRATRTAHEEVGRAEAELEGLSTPLGITTPGKAISPTSGPANLRLIREAHQRIAGSRRLRRIAELAGRLERVAAQKARSKIRPGVGEVHGIDHGCDLARLLPSELALLCHPRLRLALLARLLQRRALCYGMTGREPQANGPIVVLLDESSSMRERGKDIWSKAVCLALLATATKKKRDFHLVAFNGAIRREVSIPKGRATPSMIQEALDQSCSGGTDFDAPVIRAIELIRTSKVMKQADVIVITDGEDELEATTIESARSLTKSEGVSWFVVGVGPEAELCAISLGPIATSIVKVKSAQVLQTASVSGDEIELIVSVINLQKP
jgi:Mg-chelatase subunit ChlD